jgi:hypothetical protein
MKLYSDLNDAVSDLGEQKVINLLNRALADADYRQGYMKRRNAERDAKVRAYDEWVATGRGGAGE